MSLNGLSGVVVPFSVTVSGVRQVGWLYLLTAGGHIYALTAGATADHWDVDRPLFERATPFKSGRARPVGLRSARLRPARAALRP